jgi:flagellar hook-basal body complex protein FliE
MSDPLGLIGNSNSIQRINPLESRGVAASAKDAPSFRSALQEQIDKVNELQNAATVAMEDLATGRRDDVESVIVATQKADMAFKMLLQVRNKVVDAYEEVKQMRI